MSRNEFYEKWQERLLWLGLRGLTLDTDERSRGPFGAGQHALKLPDKVKQMVAELLQDAAGVNAIQPAANGVPDKPVPARK